MGEYNNSTFYHLLNNPFPFDCGIPALNLTLMPIDCNPCLRKRACCTSDLLPATIYVASEKSVSTLTSPCDSPPIHLPRSGIPVMNHNMINNK